MRKMQYFVMNYRHDVPDRNPARFTHQLVEVDENCLRGKIIPYWEWLDNAPEVIGFDATKKPFRKIFTTCTEDICDPPPQKETFEPYFRRPFIAIHASSKFGEPQYKELFSRVAEETGRLTAQKGFNMVYGGGNNGLMGRAGWAFNDALDMSDGTRKDHKSVQAVPVKFVNGVENSKNGNRPSNEGLYKTTDAAVILPELQTRRAVINGICVAAISIAGGSGTQDEILDILVHNKTGLGNTKLYVVNTYIEDDQEGYWDDLIKHMKKSVKRGLENKNIFNNITFVESPREAINDLMSIMREKNALPDDSYAARCEKYGLEPGQPKRLPPNAWDDLKISLT